MIVLQYSPLAKLDLSLLCVLSFWPVSVLKLEKVPYVMVFVCMCSETWKRRESRLLNISCHYTSVILVSCKLFISMQPSILYVLLTQSCRKTLLLLLLSLVLSYVLNSICRSKVTLVNCLRTGFNFDTYCITLHYLTLQR